MCRHTTPIKRFQISAGHRQEVEQAPAQEGLIWENILADAGYSSGENYAYFENKDITSYIPAHGTYKGGPEGFEYFKEGNFWLCPQGKHVTFRNQKWKTETSKTIISPPGQIVKAAL